VYDKCFATIGVAPNYKQVYKVIRKAGTARNLGRRPTVRGVAMNAIDHPHGGGRGKTSGRGPRPRSP
jgi:large subunit ribosomal protein L2